MADVNSLVLLSEVFEISLDQLIKGDVEIMKEKIREDPEDFKRLSYIFTGLFLAIAITPIPLVHFLSYVGLGIWIVILEAGIYVGWLVEKKKNQADVHTYREIMSYMEGKELSESRKAAEKRKQKMVDLWPIIIFILCIAGGSCSLAGTWWSKEWWTKKRKKDKGSDGHDRGSDEHPGR